MLQILLIKLVYSNDIHIHCSISIETCKPLTCEIDKMLLINLNDNTSPNNRIIFS